MTAAQFVERIQTVQLVGRRGKITNILPTYFEADGPSVGVGAICKVESGSSPSGDKGAFTLAAVVSVNRDSIRLVPFSPDAAPYPGASVIAESEADVVPVGNCFLGRAVDALGEPIDDNGPIKATAFAALESAVITPLARVTPDSVAETGVRAIDGLLTLGRGQRMGIFAAAGAGKTSLMIQLANQMDADHCVICLVGERGREVEDLWSRGLNPEAKAKTTLVAATSDQSAAMRARAAAFALTLADHWRQQGKHVLLFLDSATRLAMAMREMGLAAGEPPTVRAYTPSVFAAIPQLIERCGALRSGGSITGVVTVLTETDDVDDPISEMMKSLLDGHIILSRKLAEQGHFPAIDIPRSISRLAKGLMSDAHRDDAQTAVRTLSTYEESRTLIETGIYVRGSNAEIDHALDLRPQLMAFLEQRTGEAPTFASSQRALNAIVGRRR